MRAPLSVLVVLGLLATGCTSGGDDGPDPDDGPSPEAAAEALADGLRSGDLSDVPFDPATSADAQAAYDDVVAGLGDLEPAVTVADVAMYSYTAHAPEGGVSLAPHARVRDWLTRIEALPGFVGMQRSPALA